MENIKRWFEGFKETLYSEAEAAAPSGAGRDRAIFEKSLAILYKLNSNATRPQIMITAFFLLRDKMNWDFDFVKVDLPSPV